jgi:hypothetical protein
VIKLLLLALSGAKLAKVFASGGTMLISLVVYAFVFGWRYAAGFIALLFAHEMGHYLAAKAARPGGRPADLHSVRRRVDRPQAAAARRRDRSLRGARRTAARHGRGDRLLSGRR